MDSDRTASVGSYAPYPIAHPSDNEQLSRTNSFSSMSRTSSLPTGMNAVSSSPVHMRLSTPRSSKKAQHWRNSVAITNSEYYNQWRPQMSHLVKVHGSGGSMRPAPSAPSLDTISEYEMRELSADETSIVDPLSTVYQKHSKDLADPSMFRYTSTPILDPARQRAPTPLSRPTTPQVGNAGFVPTQISRANSSPAGTNPSLFRASSQAIHVSTAADNQFLPIFINPESGNVYMFEDGYYLPLSSSNVKTLETATNISRFTQPPIPDRRGIPPPTPPRDYLKFVKVLLILSALCLNIPVLLLCLLPSLALSFKTRNCNEVGYQDKARTYSEWSLCCSITAIIFHILMGLAIIVTFLLLHFIGRVFD